MSSKCYKMLLQYDRQKRKSKREKYLSLLFLIDIAVLLSFYSNNPF